MNKIYDKNIKIKFENKIIKSDGDSFIDPYGIDKFEIKNKKCEIYCYSRTSMESPSVFFLSGCKLFYYKGINPESSNKSFQQYSTKRDKKSFYQYLSYLEKNQKPSEEEIKNIFGFIKKSNIYEKISFSFEVKEKKITQQNSEDLIKLWNFLKKNSISENNKLESFESVFPELDSNNKYFEHSDMTYFKERLMIEFVNDNKFNNELERKFYLEGTNGIPATIYEIGTDNIPFGIVLPSALYSENTIPYALIELIEFIKTGLFDSDADDSEKILQEKILKLKKLIEKNNDYSISLQDENTVYFYDKIKTVFNNDYEMKFHNEPIYLTKDNYFRFRDIEEIFENRIFSVFDDCDITSEDIFCATNFNNEYAYSFSIRDNFMTFYKTDNNRKNDIIFSMKELKQKIESIACRNNDNNLHESQKNISKIRTLLEMHDNISNKLNKCVIRKKIELPREISDLFMDVWSKLSKGSKNSKDLEFYQIHFPNLFGLEKRESYFQTCMKNKGYGNIASPSKYMVSLLGKNREFFAVNLPNDFYFPEEIPYKLNEIIFCTYELMENNTNENINNLKKCLIDFKGELDRI